MSEQPFFLAFFDVDIRCGGLCLVLWHKIQVLILSAIKLDSLMSLYLPVHLFYLLFYQLVLLRSLLCVSVSSICCYYFV